MRSDKIESAKSQLFELSTKILQMLQEESLEQGKHALGLNAAGEDLNFALKELEALGESEEALVESGVLPIELLVSPWVLDN